MPKEIIRTTIVSGAGPRTVSNLLEQFLKSVGGKDRDSTVPVFAAVDEVPDRTEALLSKDPEKIQQVAQEMFNNVAILIRGIVLQSPEKAKNGLVVGISCNTFHANPIWSIFKGLIRNLAKELKVDIHVVNILKETVDFTLKNCENAKRIGVLATKGAHSLALYEEILKDAKKEPIVVKDVPDLHDTIYSNLNGLKKKPDRDFNDPDSDWAIQRLKKHLDELIDLGAEVIILGCTELRFGLLDAFKKEGGVVAYHRNIPIIDSSAVLARSLAESAIRESTRFSIKEL
ncbi:aspartate/glutamate racemase family protein [Candidatus Gracilibacteria bacterium]|nr:aspartate/glutamate racemase family protein [Candidatus Gracilibacteria bacterium]MCF7856481.1 aspartate/glutamate racemase family protein [Candidatus Gracilibacteria bacterium]MCF7896777.1 aspartate/glutamate racemase family protein [Candidatus Gracilibacteria bacterium]